MNHFRNVAKHKELSENWAQKNKQTEKNNETKQLLSLGRAS